MTRPLPILLLLALAAAALFLLPVQLPYSLELPARALPQKEWLLVRGADGRLSSSLSDHLQGTTESYAVTQVERGDHIRFERHPAATPGAAVAVGDTIGTIRSNLVERQWIELQGDLAAENASLDLYLAGEKESVVRAAQLRLEQARKRVEQQQREVDRLGSLLERELVSAEDYEIAATDLELYRIQTDIDDARLRAVRTGAREQRVDWVRARIAALEKEMEVVQERMRAAVLLSPVAGRIASLFSGDTLAVVQDTGRYVLLLPVPWEQRRYIAPGQPLEIDLGSDLLTGRIAALDRTAHSLPGGRQIGWVRGIVEAASGPLAPGLVVRCRIACDPVSPLEYLRRFLSP